MINDNLRAYGDFLLVRKCGVGQILSDGSRGVAREDGTPLLVFPDYYADTTNFVEIIDVGVDCKWFTSEHGQHGESHGETTLCPEMGDQMHHVEAEWWMVKESLLFPVLIRNDGIVAIGDCIVVTVPKKDNSRLIITPEIIEDKSFTYPIHSIGGKVKEPMTAGQSVVTAAQLRIFNVGGKQYGCLREEDVVGIVE